MNDRYRVRMDVTPSATDDGTPHYKITEVLDFTPAERQTSLPLKKKRQAPKSKRKPPANTVSPVVARKGRWRSGGADIAGEELR